MGWWKKTKGWLGIDAPDWEQFDPGRPEYSGWVGSPEYQKVLASFEGGLETQRKGVMRTGGTRIAEELAERGMATGSEPGRRRTELGIRWGDVEAGKRVGFASEMAKTEFQKKSQFEQRMDKYNTYISQLKYQEKQAEFLGRKQLLKDIFSILPTPDKLWDIGGKAVDLFT